MKNVAPIVVNVRLSGLFKVVLELPLDTDFFWRLLPHVLACALLKYLLNLSTIVRTQYWRVDRSDNVFGMEDSWKCGVLWLVSISSAVVCADWLIDIGFPNLCLFVKLVPTAGHSANEPGIATELVAACEMHKSFSQKGQWKIHLQEGKTDDDLFKWRQLLVFCEE